MRAIALEKKALVGRSDTGEMVSGLTSPTMLEWDLTQSVTVGTGQISCTLTFLSERN